MDAMVTARVPVEIKKQVGKTLESLGLTTSQAINALFEYVFCTGELPDFRSETQKAYEGCPRVVEPGKITSDMIRVAKAMRSLESLGPVDWGEDAGKSYRELLEEGRRADYEAFL